MNIDMVWIRIWGCLNPAQLSYFCLNCTPYQILESVDFVLKIPVSESSEDKTKI